MSWSTVSNQRTLLRGFVKGFGGYEDTCMSYSTASKWRASWRELGGYEETSCLSPDETPVHRVLRSPPGVNGPSKSIRKYHQDGEGVRWMVCTVIFRSVAGLRVLSELRDFSLFWGADETHS